MEENALIQKGKGKGTYYIIGESIRKGAEIMTQALEIGLQKLKEEGRLE